MRTGLGPENRRTGAEALAPHAAAAIFWYMRNRTFFDQQLEARRDVFIIRYEDVVAAPHEQIERVCRFLEVRFESRMVSKVFRSSVGKLPFPELPEGITALCAGMTQRLDRVLAAEGSDA